MYVSHLTWLLVFEWRLLCRVTPASSSLSGHSQSWQQTNVLINIPHAESGRTLQEVFPWWSTEILQLIMETLTHTYTCLFLSPYLHAACKHNLDYHSNMHRLTLIEFQVIIPKNPFEEVGTSQNVLTLQRCPHSVATNHTQTKMSLTFQSCPHSLDKKITHSNKSELVPLNRMRWQKDTGYKLKVYQNPNQSLRWQKLQSVHSEYLIFHTSLASPGQFANMN